MFNDNEKIIVNKLVHISTSLSSNKYTKEEADIKVKEVQNKYSLDSMEMGLYCLYAMNIIKGDI